MKKDDVNITTKNYEFTCPKCKRHEGNIINKQLFRYNAKDWGLVCIFCGWEKAWEEAKDKRLFSSFL
ncbi:MAG: hypothetical protein FJ241_11650 [Nitrospira sp.]|nr:hypothetical protein [Nitrospira sp.]